MTIKPDANVSAIDEARIDEFMRTFLSIFSNVEKSAGKFADATALFVPTATITKVAQQRSVHWTPIEFAAPRLEPLSNGRLENFREWEVSSRTIVASPLAMRWSAFHKTGVLDGVPFAGTGHQFLTFAKRGQHWLIEKLIWEDLG